jgi:hypothetical protein
MQFVLKLIHYDKQAYRIILKTIHLTLDYCFKHKVAKFVSSIFHWYTNIITFGNLI